MACSRLQEGACGASNGSAFRAVTYQYDGTRPVLGNDDGNLNLNKNMDVQGFSHKSGSTFDSYHEAFPEKPTFASECCSCTTHREDKGAGPMQCTSGQSSASNDRDFMTGTMVWTLFDYYGEDHGWPNIASKYGQFDLAGFPKNTAYWYRSWWLGGTNLTSDDRPSVGGEYQANLLNYWDAAPTGALTGHPNQIAGITNAPFAELFLNGKSLGTQRTERLGHLSWDIPEFSAGNLTMAAMDTHNRTVATDTMVTVGDPDSVQLQIDTPAPSIGTGSAVFLDGQDVAMLRGTVVDKNGNRVHNSTAVVTYMVVSGPGRVLATHNGDSANHEPNLSPWHSSYGGLTRAIVQTSTDAGTPAWHRRRLLQIDAEANLRTQIADPDDAQAPVPPAGIVIQATSPGLKSCTITIPVSTDPAAGVLASAYSAVGAPLALDTL